MLFYVHWNGAAIFVKAGLFFQQQGGLTEEWGKAWRSVEANSIEDAREKGYKLFGKKPPSIRI